MVQRFGRAAMIDGAILDYQPMENLEKRTRTAYCIACPIICPVSKELIETSQISPRRPGH